MTIISPLPFTLTNGTTADASEVMADLNQIRNDVNSNVLPAFGGYRGCVAYQAVVTPLPSGVLTAPIFAATTVDTNGSFSLTNPTRLTVPAGVTKIRLITQLGFAAANSQQNIQILLYKNGVYPVPTIVVNKLITVPTTSGGFTDHITTPALAVSVGDYFEFFISQNSGSAASLFAWCEMEILG